MEAPQCGTRERGICGVVEIIPTEGEASWHEVRTFLVDHLPTSWQLLGAALRVEAAAGTPVPRADGRRWFVAKASSSPASASSLRGVLLTYLHKRGEQDGITIDVSMFVPEHEDDIIAEALIKQGVDWSVGEVRLAGLRREWLPIVKRVADTVGARESWHNPCLALHCPENWFKTSLTREAAASLVREQSLKLDSLSSKSNDAHVVVSKWKYASEESDNYIAACIRHAPSSCIRKDTVMIAWIGLHWDMSLGFFWVEEDYRRLGKALAVDQVFKTFDYVRPFLNPDQVGAYFFTEDDNDASKTLFQSLGFKVFAEVFWGSFTQADKDTNKNNPLPTQQTCLSKVNLAEKFSMFSDHWNPKIVGEVDDLDVKIAKIKGEFVWHKHDNEDELFLIIKGSLLIQVREADGQETDIHLNEGEFFIVPKGVEHKPIAKEECSIMLLEKRGLLNTGNIRNERTVEHLQRI